MGWQHRFTEREWTEVRDFESAVWADTRRGHCLLAIIDSVLANKADQRLAVTTSMHDLVVVARPVPDPPMDVLVVRSPSSLQSPAPGFVRIEHVTVVGRDTRIDRPDVDAVSLFRCFVADEFGIKIT